MRVLLFRFTLLLSDVLCPGDWAWYALDSLERETQEAVQRAVIAMDRRAKRVGWDRIHGLADKGTRRE